ncbi:MAG: ergothioneine biosynthesis protein EgtB [Myxococcota bacterium]|nr:ergothioneine biosynthesis protein EgtB [Myxococcota bacterium]
MEPASPHPEPALPPEAYRAVRQRTLELAAPLSPEDQLVQSMPDASPTKWHLAHTTWFFETFLLQPHLPGYAPFHPAFGYLFNSYYEAAGERHERPKRGVLSRPPHAQVLAYRQAVDEAMERLLSTPLPPELEALVVLGLNHEQQHQELILTDIKHALSQNVLRPVYAPAPPSPPLAVQPLCFVRFEGGLGWLGDPGPGFAFDNERPRHQVFVQPFRLAQRLVTAGEFQEFIADGGYRRPGLWLSEGWDRVRQEGWTAPLYWEQREGEAWHFTLHGMERIDPAAPVTHLSFFEADAYAHWKDARLPTEAEWESAAAHTAPSPDAANFVETGLLHPGAAPAGDGVQQLLGDVWEWTRSDYGPYPGFRTAPGAVGEYNGKFMCNQYVLRGGSCASPRSHLRLTYRNFFPAATRWQFSGLRLAQEG